MNIERMFLDEVRDKKRTASGVHSRTGKRGYVGKMKFPSDFLKGKEKRDYLKASKVRVYNMYDEIISYKDFMLLDNEGRKKYLEGWTRLYTVNEIAEAWGITYKNTYNHFKRADINIVKKSPRGRNGGRRKVNTAIVETTQAPIIEQKIVEVVAPKHNGFAISYNGEYTAEEVATKLEKIGIILSDEAGQRYKVEISIMELGD